MEIKLKDLAKSIGMDGKFDSYLDEAIVKKPQINISNQIVTLKLILAKPLPFILYFEFINQLSNHLNNYQINLIIETRDSDISAHDAQQYLQHYLQSICQKQILNSVSVILKADTLELLVLDQVDYKTFEEELKNIEKYFNQVGINKQISLTLGKARQEVKTNIVNVKDIRPQASENKQKYYRKSNNNKYQKVRIKDLDDSLVAVEIEGTIFKIDNFETARKNIIQTIYLADKESAYQVKRFEGQRLSREEIESIRVGDYVSVQGNHRYDEYARENLIIADNIEAIPNPDKIIDKAEQKRVELHAHSNRSEMDAIPQVTDLLDYAYQLGHPGVALTDHMVIQGFPDAQNYLDQLKNNDPEADFKVLYGVEFNMVDDNFEIIKNYQNQEEIGNEFIIFDIETTGLSSQYDKMIEFGAVKLVGNTVTDKLQFFVNPNEELSDFTINLTGIKQEDVDQGIDISQAMDKIFAFFEDLPLVAHNASFDIGFLNSISEKLGLKPIKNIIIDTLAMSRVIHSERRNHALGNVARLYNISYDGDVAHRADYDADVLASVFIRLMEDITELDCQTYDDIQNLVTLNHKLKAFPKHVNVIAKNQEGLKNLFKLITQSHTEEIAILSGSKGDASKSVSAEPRILRSSIEKYRDDFLIGSSCQNGEVFDNAMIKSQQELIQSIEFYDYIEVMPKENYRNLIDRGTIPNEERLEAIIMNIIETAKKLNKVVVATGDVHYLKPEDKILRDIYINAMAIGGGRHPLYIFDKEKRKHSVAPDQHFRTTDEMLRAFDFLNDPQLAEEIVVDNTNFILDQVDEVKPLKSKLYPPHIKDSEKKLTQLCYDNAHKIYGENLPEIVEERLRRELKAIIDNGFAVIYYISYLLVDQSIKDGYIVGSRGSVGSSFVATMANITEVNPLPPHYICLNCHHHKFFLDGSVSSGYDLPNKECPVCKSMLKVDGQDIPFETFLGFEGDKVPDIDLNFSGEYQEVAHNFTKEIFGEDYVYRAGTIGTVAERTAFGYVSGYIEEKDLPEMNQAERQYLASNAEGVKRTTGQHPGGIIVVPDDMDIHDFTPVQYPANNVNNDWLTTHFEYGDLEENLLKLDILGHVDPTAMKLLEDVSGLDVTEIPMNDPKVMSIFNSVDALNIDDRYYQESTGALGLPEFGTPFVRRMLEATKPNSFSDLLRISGLSHGTDVWANNAELLIKEHNKTLEDVIGCRDDIMVYLIQAGLKPKDAFDIMESVRKGRGLTDEWLETMRENDVPEWYIDSCQKIKYMFPKAHAVAYVIMAVRVAWFKVYYPLYYYISFFTLRANAFDIETMIEGKEAVQHMLADIKNRMYSRDTKNQVTNREREIMTTLEVTNEMYLRGYKFSNIDIYKSDAVNFIIDPEDDTALIPPFSSIDGLGESVAYSIVKARNERDFLSKEDLVKRTLVSKNLMLKLDEMGVLKDLEDENQMSFF